MRIAINGFGRIGRIFFRQAFGMPDIEIVAVNDLGNTDNLAYLLSYDSAYGRYGHAVQVKGDTLIIDGKEVQCLHEKDPAKLPWKDLKIDVVVESTGVFTTTEKAMAHVNAGAGRVVISAPAKDDVTPTATPNVGMRNMKDAHVTSNASCTTNAATPVVAIMMFDPGIERGMLSTAHGYTATESLVDGPAMHDVLRGRAAAVNIIPSSTGAAEAVGRVIPEMKGKFDGIAFRVPVITGSIIDFTFVAKRKTTKDEINEIFRKAAKNPAWAGILEVSEIPLVSTDIIGNPHGSIVDLSLTRVVDGTLVKICAWYDNEWGYCAMLLRHILAL